MHWDITKQENDYKMVSFSKEGIRTFISDSGGSIKEFRYEDYNESVYFSGKIHNSEVHVSSSDNVNNQNSSFKSKITYWYQPLGFCFFDFACSEDTSRQFFMVNQKDLEPVKMVIKKKGTEIINLHNKEVPALKAELRLSGILAPFWSGTYWLNPENGILLRYIGTFGPGTETTTMELQESSGQIFFN